MRIADGFKYAVPCIAYSAVTAIGHIPRHPAGEGEDDVVLAVHRHVIYHASPKLLAELCHHLRQGLQRVNESSELPTPDAAGASAAHPILFFL